MKKCECRGPCAIRQVTGDRVCKDTAELVRLLQFVLDKGDKPMWLSDGWREDAELAIRAVNGDQG